MLPRQWNVTSPFILFNAGTLTSVMHLLTQQYLLCDRTLLDVNDRVRNALQLCDMCFQRQSEGIMGKYSGKFNLVLGHRGSTRCVKPQENKVGNCMPM